jgi:hypothetical protein
MLVQFFKKLLTTFIKIHYNIFSYISPSSNRGESSGGAGGAQAPLPLKNPMEPPPTRHTHQPLLQFLVKEKEEKRRKKEEDG